MPRFREGMKVRAMGLLYKYQPNVGTVTSVRSCACDDAERLLCPCEAIRVVSTDCSGERALVKEWCGYAFAPTSVVENTGREDDA